ncbi:hypothetical protein DFH27DRAFT_587226, partial [Peziza echinospora]
KQPPFKINLPPCRLNDAEFDQWAREHHVTRKRQKQYWLRRIQKLPPAQKTPAKTPNGAKAVASSPAKAAEKDSIVSAKALPTDQAEGDPAHQPATVDENYFAELDSLIPNPGSSTQYLGSESEKDSSKDASLTKREKELEKKQAEGQATHIIDNNLRLNDTVNELASGQDCRPKRRRIDSKPPRPRPIVQNFPEIPIVDNYALQRALQHISSLQEEVSRLEGVVRDFKNELIMIKDAVQAIVPEQLTERDPTDYGESGGGESSDGETVTT